MFKFVTKNFSVFTKTQNSLKSINSLNKFMMKNYESLTTDDKISAINKFHELEPNDPNSKIKLYDFLDYILVDEKAMSDNALLKTIMQVMLSVQLYDSIYWEKFKKIIFKNNLLYSSPHNYLDYLKTYSIVSYDDNEIWKIFEEYFLEQYGGLDFEQIQSIALCFANSKKGTKRFWETIFSNFDLKKNDGNNGDFILNFSIALCGFLQSKIVAKIDPASTQLFCKYLNFSIDYLNKKIMTGIIIEKIDVVYSLFPHFHKSFYIDKIQDKYPHIINKELFQEFIENLEKVLKNYMDTVKLEEEDVEQISKILHYASENKIKFEILKSPLFVTIFVGNYQNFKNAKDLDNFLYYFYTNKIKTDILVKEMESDVIWEKIIDSVHLMSFKELINISNIMSYYNVKHFRLWIFLQNFFRDNIEEDLETIKVLNESGKNYDKYAKAALKKTEQLYEIFAKPYTKLKYEDFIFAPFIIYVRTTLNKLIVLSSHLPLEGFSKINKNAPKH